MTSTNELDTDESNLHDRLPWVAVIDDEPVIREVARAALRHAGFQVLTAVNGQEGISIIEKFGRRIQAVLLDITMPVMDGAATLRWLRANGYHLPVILTSGYSEQEVRLQFEGLTYHGFLAKPFTAPDLISVIRAAATGAV